MTLFREHFNFGLLNQVILTNNVEFLQFFILLF